jgi:hypothetical protein
MSAPPPHPPFDPQRPPPPHTNTQYILNATSDGWVSVAGFSLPVGWACWAELVYTSLISPNASFLGHLCGK